ncbi:hypothetical protein KC19_10G164600 [Ceratodon purpureus]|uniref:Uncharacterized protein n=1 Tax=Ceratodon purpureus TaxID=3225 RepID=A0A8T0GMP6_CERPU|nr:hypothetical protein KC19_10G164600 [Ceratodon purpureus]
MDLAYFSLTNEHIKSHEFLLQATVIRSQSLLHVFCIALNILIAESAFTGDLGLNSTLRIGPGDKRTECRVWEETRSNKRRRDDWGPSASSFSSFLFPHTALQLKEHDRLAHDIPDLHSPSSIRHLHMNIL